MSRVDPGAARLAFVLVLALAASATVAAAAEDEPRWEWSITPYVWATDIGEDLRLGGEVVGGNDTEFSDLVDKIESSLQLLFEGVRDRWGMFADLSYVEVSDSGEGEFGILRLDADIEEQVLEGGAIYRPAGGARNVDVLFGVRYLSVDEDYRLTGGEQEPLRRSIDEDYVDALVGVRYHVPFADRWVVSLKGDVSAGGTDLTWTTQALVGWQFGARRQSGIFVDYRHRATEYGKTDRFDIEKTLSGFGVAVKIGF